MRPRHLAAASIQAAKAVAYPEIMRIGTERFTVRPSSCTVSPHPSFVSPYWDFSIAALEETLSIGMILCTVRSVRAFINASGAETAHASTIAQTKFFEAKSRGHATFYIIFIISRDQRKILTHILGALLTWTTGGHG